jgi:hypothetical protein
MAPISPFGVERRSNSEAIGATVDTSLTVSNRRTRKLTQHAIRANAAPGTAGVSDNFGLTEQYSHALSHNARNRIAASARGKRHKHCNGARRIGLRCRITPDRRERRNAGRETKKLSARKI